MKNPMMLSSHTRRVASLIVECLAILFVVGVVAAVAIPDADSATPDKNLRSAVESLRDVRGAIGRYWADHNATFPTLDQLREIAKPQPGTILSHRARPLMSAYLEKIPPNPFTGGTTIGSVDADIGDSDWIYDPGSGVFKANDAREHREL
jgi:hypothetical protein